MTRKQAKQVPVKPRFSPLNSIKNTGVSIGYLAIGGIIVVFAPLLWVFLFGKGIRDALAKAADARVQRRLERGSRRNKKASPSHGRQFSTLSGAGGHFFVQKKDPPEGHS